MLPGLTTSVALATYNGAQFLREQLDSLARQTLQPSELVVCDDGSTDGTLALLADWAQDAPFPVRLYPNPERLGFADNFLRAASLCHGDLIAFCDQDDVWMPEKLACCAGWFRGDPDVTLVGHNAWVTDQNLVTVGRLHSRSRTSLYPRHQLRLLDYKFFGYALVFRRSLLSLAPSRDRPRDFLLKGSMPHDHWVPFLAAAMGTVVLDGRTLALYRQHGRNAFGAHWSDSPAHPVAEDPGTLELRQERLSGLFSEWAEYLGRCAKQQASPEDAARLRQASVRCGLISRRYGFRAALHRDSPAFGARVRRFLALAGTGGYRHHRNGGLGLRPLARDMVLVALKGKAGPGC